MLQTVPQPPLTIRMDDRDNVAIVANEDRKSVV